MRSVHILGLGMVVGMLALGSMLAVMGYQWQQSTYVDVAEPQFPPEGGPIVASPQQIAQGRGLFEQRCQGCHSIGQGPRTGPDLEGVTARRPYNWLVEIITDPQRLIERSDPIMTELLGEWQVPMPDTGTNAAEAATIIAYIHSESPEQAPPLKVPAGGTPAEGDAATPAPAGNEPAGGAAVPGGDASRGQVLFQQQCSGCHSIGEGPRAGTDLQGVTQRRPVDELIQFIQDPQQFGSSMPNLGVTEPEARDIAAHIAEES